MARKRVNKPWSQRNIANRGESGFTSRITVPGDEGVVKEAQGNLDWAVWKGARSGALSSSRLTADCTAELKIDRLQMKNFEKALRNACGNIASQALRALKEEADAIMAEAKAQCPVDSTGLRESGFVEEAEWTKRSKKRLYTGDFGPEMLRAGLQVTLSFGRGPDGNATRPTDGRDVDYAIIQHENLDYAHPNGGKAKYLEDPLNKALKGFDTRIASRIRQHPAAAAAPSGGGPSAPSSTPPGVTYQGTTPGGLAVYSGPGHFGM